MRNNDTLVSYRKSSENGNEFCIKEMQSIAIGLSGDKLLSALCVAVLCGGLWQSSARLTVRRVRTVLERC